MQQSQQHRILGDHQLSLHTYWPLAFALLPDMSASMGFTIVFAILLDSIQESQKHRIHARYRSHLLALGHGTGP